MDIKKKKMEREREKEMEKDTQKDYIRLRDFINKSLTSFPLPCQVLVSPSASLHCMCPSTITPSSPGLCSTSTPRSAALCPGPAVIMNGTQKTALTTLGKIT